MKGDQQVGNKLIPITWNYNEDEPIRNTNWQDHFHKQSWSLIRSHKKVFGLKEGDQ